MLEAVTYMQKAVSLTDIDRFWKVTPIQVISYLQLAPPKFVQFVLMVVIFVKRAC